MRRGLFALSLALPLATTSAHAQESASITINVTGPESTRVTLDDQPLAWSQIGERRAIAPGMHVVRAVADGYRTIEQRLDVADGQSWPVEITMVKDARPSAPPAPPAAPPTATTGGSSNKTLAYVAFGVGGASLAVGVATGLFALSRRNDLKKACNLPSDGCPSNQQSNLDTYHAMGTASTIGFVAFAVSAVTGVVLLLTAPKDAPNGPGSAAFISPYVGPGSLGATGRF